MNTIIVKTEETEFSFEGVSDTNARYIMDLTMEVIESEVQEELETLEQTCEKLGIPYSNVIERLTAAGLSEENLSVL